MSLSVTTAKPRVFVDASHTFASGLNTGVQRVVRNTCKLIGESLDGHQTATVVVKGNKFVLTNMQAESEKRRCMDQIRANVLASTPASYQFSAKVLCKVMPLPIFKKWFLPESGHQGIFKLPLLAYQAWLNRNDSRSEAQPGAGDLLLLPDAYWAKEEIWPAVKQAKACGAKVAVVVYDLIPLTHPQFVPQKAALKFKEYLQQVAQYADMVIAISDTVRKQVETLFSSDEYAGGCQHFASFELGAEFAMTQGDVRPHIQSLFSQDAVNAPHLMVSTFDPRKNHNYAIDAFERVWQDYPDRKLCFIGRVGWLCNDVVERIRQHPRYEKQLFALHDLSDSELFYCYQRARSVVFPSIVEGFGLPIAEALWHGKHVFVSDTEIHREVGRDECHYCDLASPESLAKQILNWESEHGEVSPSRTSSYRPVSWKQSIRNLATQCVDALTPEWRGSRPYQPRLRASIGSSMAARRAG